MVGAFAKAQVQHALQLLVPAHAQQGHVSKQCEMLARPWWACVLALSCPHASSSLEGKAISSVLDQSAIYGDLEYATAAVSDTYHLNRRT